MTLYRPVSKSGFTALPCSFLTTANIFILSQPHPEDWRVEQITVPDFEDEQDRQASLAAANEGVPEAIPTDEELEDMALRDAHERQVKFWESADGQHEMKTEARISKGRP